MADIRRAIDAGNPENLTVKQWLARWLTEHRDRVKPDVWRNYESTLRLHVVPYIGDALLAELARSDVIRLLDELSRKPINAHRPEINARGRGKVSKPLSTRTRDNVHVVLATALEGAVEAEIVTVNVAAKVKHIKVTHRAKVILRAEQVRIVLAAAAGDPLEAAYVLGLTLGLREGEVLGLRWDRVFFTAREILIDASLGKRGTARTTILGDTKSDAGKRIVLMPPAAHDALRRLRQVEKSEWLFPDVRKDTFLRKHWHGVCKRAGVPPMPFHDTRHTAATLMLGERVAADVVQNILGHSDVSTTLRTYAHVTRERRAEAAAAMDRLLSEPDGATPRLSGSDSSPEAEEAERS